MLSLDDRAGNVTTTVVVFVIAVVVLYVARAAFFILLLSLLFAYLLEPAVSLIQSHSRIGRGNRTLAIAQVYFLAFLVFGSLAYEFGPHLVEQIKSLNTALPRILEGLSDGKVAADLGAKHGLNPTRQQHIHDWLVHNHDTITRGFERGAASAAYVAASAVWLFVVPILAIFILRDGHQLADAVVQAVGRGRNSPLKRIVGQVDAMLARYMRAQVALAGLSFLFYSVSMFLLGFPYAIALGLVGGVLEFLPGVGWIASAVLILTIGALAHAHWMWMGALLLLWRFVQDYVNSPHIMGDNLHLQPLTILFALMVGTEIGGIAGAYLSVPTVAVLRIVWQAYFPAKSSAALSEQPLTQIEA